MHLLKIKNTYWAVKDCDPKLAEVWIKAGLRKANVTSAKFIVAVNNIAGYRWIEDEISLQTAHNATDASHLWIVTLSSLKVELREKHLGIQKRNGQAWNKKFAFMVSRS